ncbi:MAG: precorrin-4 C(11)-methyltransferase [Chloroflexota bacterium]
MTRFTPEPGKVYIIGAGPGAPDLIAVRGKEIIEQADLVLYADSLVEYSVANIARKEGAQIIPSSSLHLGELIETMVTAAKAGKVVARVHSGDPALYGATHEQMAQLEDYDVSYEIVPGITAAFAAAALLQVELTIPDLVQTIILTRTAGRTSMPEKEDLQRLASAGASLAIYLSVTRIKRVIEDLLASGGYTAETPVAVLHKTTWPDESHVIGTLADIAEKVKKAGYTKHALILVSPALDQGLKGAERRTSSHLYDKTYTHRFRKAVDFSRGKEKAERAQAPEGVVLGEKHLGQGTQREGTAVITLTHRGTQLGRRLARQLSASLFVPQKFSELAPKGTPFSSSALAVVQQQWAQKANLMLVMPTGVASRAIAPLLQHKTADPAVLCLDEQGQFVIPLVGGHVAGANELARTVADLTAGTAVITTASDLQGKPALDLLGRKDGWKIDPNSALTAATATLVNDGAIGLFVAEGLAQSEGHIARQIAPLLACDNVVQVASLDELDVDTYEAGIIVSHEVLSDHHVHLLNKSVLYRPSVLVVGMGCKRGVETAVLADALGTTLAQNGLSKASVAMISTADVKADEAGLTALAAQMRIPLAVVVSDRLAALDAAQFSPSAAQEKFGIVGVAEPTAVLVSEGELIVPKQSFGSCTVAVALKK